MQLFKSTPLKPILFTLTIALALGGGVWVYREKSKPVLTDFSGENRALSSVKGRKVILHFWASWCAPCMKEIPEIIDRASRVDEKKWVFVLVSTDRKLEDAKKMLPESATRFPEKLVLLFDRDGKFAESQGSYQFPETYLLDEKGEVVTKWIGPQPWAKSELDPFFR